MSEVIYGWMRNLAFFFIFMTAILNCLPSNQYRKYVEFFLGLTLMIVLCKPILQLFDLEENFSDALSSAMFEQEMESTEQSMFSVEGTQEELLLGAYETELENQIKILLEEKGIGAHTIHVKLQNEETMAVEKINIHVYDLREVMYGEEEKKAKEDFKEKVDAVKEELMQVFCVEESHINISGRGT